MARGNFRKTLEKIIFVNEHNEILSPATLQKIDFENKNLVYEIVFPTGKSYVGSTKNLHNRLYRHFMGMVNFEHKNRLVMEEYNTLLLAEGANVSYHKKDLLNLLCKTLKVKLLVYTVELDRNVANLAEQQYISINIAKGLSLNILNEKQIEGLKLPLHNRLINRRVFLGKKFKAGHKDSPTTLARKSQAQRERTRETLHTPVREMLSNNTFKSIIEASEWAGCVRHYIANSLARYRRNVSVS